MTKKKGTKKGGCKKFLVASLVSLVFSSVAVAQTVENDLVGLGMKPEVAEYLAGIIPAGSALDNNVYLKGDNQANNATINIAKIDTGDNTVINSSASDELILQLEDDASRLISFTAASDAALAMKFGDAGTTATQMLTVTASTSDADDDSSLRLCGGGAYGTDGSRGACLVLPGEEVAGGSDITINAGSGDQTQIQVAGTNVAVVSGTGVAVTGAITASTSIAATTAVSATTNVSFGDELIATGNSSYAAAGTATGDAVAIVESVSYVTGADGTKGARLPAATTGSIFIVQNNGASALKLYPHTGGAIGAAATDASVSIAANAFVLCYKAGTNLWFCGEAPNA